MNFDFFGEFCTIAKNMSLTNAARELHTTQAALTKHLESAERELGTRLIERKRGASSFAGLTPEGERFLSACLSITYSYRSLRADLERMRREGSHRLRMVASFRSPLTPLASVIRGKLTERGLEAQIQWVSNRQKTSFDMLRDREADVALEPYSPMADTTGLSSVSVIKSPAVLVLSSDDPAANGEKISAREFGRLRFLSLADQTAYPARKHFHSIARAFDFTPYFEMIPYDSESIMLADYLERGCAFICPALCRDYFASVVPKAAFLEVEESEAAFDMRIFYRDERDPFMAKVAEVFRDL